MRTYLAAWDNFGLLAEDAADMLLPNKLRKSIQFHAEFMRVPCKLQGPRHLRLMSASCKSDAGAMQVWKYDASMMQV